MVDEYVDLVVPHCPRQRCPATGNHGTICSQHKERLEVRLDGLRDVNLKSWLITRIKFAAMDARRSANHTD